MRDAEPLAAEMRCGWYDMNFPGRQGPHSHIAGIAEMLTEHAQKPLSVRSHGDVSRSTVYLSSEITHTSQFSVTGAEIISFTKVIRFTEVPNKFHEGLK